MPDSMPLSSLPCDTVILNLSWDVRTFYILNFDIQGLESLRLQIDMTLSVLRV